MSVIRGVMLIGNLHLTTHRLLFHAVLPPDSAFVPSDQTPEPEEKDAENAFAVMLHRPDTLYAGPITMHRTGPLTPSKRVWLDLGAEMITTYPSGDEADRVRPLRSVLRK